MSALRVRSASPGADGLVVSVTPESAGWTYVGFAVHRLSGRLELLEEERETCVVLLAGSCSLLGLGEASRASVFDGPPTALYVPPGTSWWAEGEGDLAVCTAPARGGLEPRLLDAPELVTRGSGTEERYIANILMESEPAESLLVTEVITPAGHWSSFPPHKHDRDDPPHERALEETYYHRLRGGRGFAFQRVYTDDGGLDEAIAAEDGDVVLVPRGYHPVAGDPRGDLYYLNVMAGPVREWRVSVAPGFD
ncbi:MAG TPA: 5-deoxy-glucuronate isomerase [Gaiellaceae bacterium]|nr:5-deoxy-glucuronate isomerase [Gaiellaceae bacterium]